MSTRTEWRATTQPSRTDRARHPGLAEEQGGQQVTEKPLTADEVAALGSFYGYQWGLPEAQRDALRDLVRFAYEEGEASLADNSDQARD